jgi:hypothetical protein
MCSLLYKPYFPLKGAQLITMNIKNSGVNGHIVLYECFKSLNLQILGAIFIISNKHMAPCVLCLKCLRKPFLNINSGCSYSGKSTMSCNNVPPCLLEASSVQCIIM